jgi:D-aminopeptidase
MRRCSSLLGCALSLLILPVASAAQSDTTRIRDLTAATTVERRDGHTQEALPLDRLRTILRDAGRIAPN